MTALQPGTGGVALPLTGLRRAVLERFWRCVAAAGLRRAEALFHLGNVRFAAGRREPAIEAWARAVATDPRHAKAWHNYANALLDADRTAEAAEAFAALERIAGQSAGA